MKNMVSTESATETLAKITARLSALVLFASIVGGLFVNSDGLAVALLVFSVIALAALVAARWWLDRIAEAQHRAALKSEVV